jgi:hypothetical protein
MASLLPGNTALERYSFEIGTLSAIQASYTGFRDNGMCG